jgi:signal transduction histidine kinase/HAMP domain-containing protein
MPIFNTQAESKPWRLRNRLALALAAIFALFFAVQFVYHLEVLDDQKDARVESMHKVNQTVAAVFEGFTHDMESFSLSTAITLGDARLAIDLESARQTGPTVNNYLRHLFDSHGLLRAIFITDPNGTVVFSAEGGSGGVSVAGRSYITALQQGADSFWSEGVAGLQSGRTTVSHSRKIVTPEGVTTGFLVMAFYPDLLASRLPAGLIEQGHLSLIDHSGQVILQLPPSEGMRDARLSDWSALAAARTGEDVVLRSQPIPLHTDDRYGSLIGLNTVDWVVGYSLPAAAVHGSATSLFQRNMVIVSFLLLGGLGVMVFISSRLSRPLSTLADVAGAIARGEPVPELKQLNSTEADVSVLVRTMEQMRLAIAGREERLKAQAIALESIQRVGESLASELDLDRAFEAIVDAGCALGEAEGAFVLYRPDPESAFEPIARRGESRLLLPVNHPVVAEVLNGATLHIPELKNQVIQGNGHQTTPGTAARSVLAIPVRSRGGDQVVGALFLLHSSRAAFTAQHQRMARGLARWAGIVIENARLYRQGHEMMEMLRKANADKDEFLALVSHELRTPITTIYGGARLLHVRRGRLTPEVIDDMIVSIAEESERLYRLVEDLLAIARTEMSQEVDREPVSLAGTLEQAASQFSRSRQRMVELHVPEDLDPVLAEPTYLQQVVTNLLTNADKYSPADQPIEVDAERDGSMVRVRVMDRGPGVEESELGQIFERFYRSQSAISSASGKGLGLTVCLRLIQALGGNIWAENRPGGGLSVNFTLQVADTAEAVGASGQASSAGDMS